MSPLPEFVVSNEKPLAFHTQASHILDFDLVYLWSSRSREGKNEKYGENVLLTSSKQHNIRFKLEHSSLQQWHEGWRMLQMLNGLKEKGFRT